ncbi:Hypothetical protein P9515_13761 [Prochlorococcus marinus str. MIT 9515]|uniref:Colanic acid biosynthesis acetyltransferase WcaF n=1 Tax=Prochlorococcus marinus (strain MIT 9515) TaxID=167542 RepID=A2BXS2_PROM5|nr:putative colanic acid biosynthesis acetyltransferase [Prochlorococcus marinus]ABM72583.1 Hypothetical protein P9515_13761 [Prochlorococcus marinus str. MIT 9515]
MRLQNLNLYEKKKNSISIIIVKLIWDFFGKPLFSSYIPGTYWRKLILRIFRAKIGKGGKIKTNIKISEPWNLSIGDHCWIGEDVWIDNLALVKIGNRVCISQGVYLCTGNHNYKKDLFNLILERIVIEDDCWIAAKSIIAPGAILKRGSVTCLGSLVSGILEKDGIYKGNPAKLFKLKDDNLN